MENPRMDLNLFRVFDGIYQEGNLTRAAEVLRITQPAVSNALSRLRVMYDDPLFTRNAKGMTPTPFAESIAGDIRVALNLLNHCVQPSESFDPSSDQRHFRIVAGDMTAAMLIPKLMSFVESYEKNISIEVLPLIRTNVVHALASGQADFALDAVPFADPQINSSKVMEDQFVCVISDSHPHRSEALSLDQYLDFSHAHASSRHRGVGQIDLSLRRLGKQRRILLHTHSHLGLSHVVAASELAASIPSCLATVRHLRALSLPFDTPAAEVYAFWHKNSENDRGNSWFREILRESGKP